MKTYFVILIFFGFISCTKQAAYGPDTEKPAIQVIYPLDNPTIISGSPLCMKVLISDNKSLMNVWLQVNDGQGFKKEYAIPGRSIDIIEKYITQPGTTGNLYAKFFAVDEAGNLNTAEISFSVNN